MDTSLPATEEGAWRVRGYEEGIAAARGDMFELKPSFILEDADLSLGHDILDGVYNLVWRCIADFPSLDCGAAWSEGVHAGAHVSGARVGYQTMSEAKNVIYVFVTKGIASQFTSAYTN